MYRKDVVERVVKILKASGNLSEAHFSILNQDHKEDVLSILIQNGLDEDLVQIVLARAYALRRKTISSQMIEEKAFSLLPIKFMEKEEMIPFALVGRFLHVGIIDPTQITLNGQIKAMTHFNIECFVITPSMFQECLQYQPLRKLHESTKDKDKFDSSVNPKPKKRHFKNDDGELVAQFCDSILQSASELEVSDIHIEPFRGVARLRFRINGLLEIQEDYHEYLYHNYLAIVTRLKILADCDISEKRLPQDGAISYQDKNDHTVDTRFNILPGKYGERIVIRLLKNSPDLQIDKLGFRESDLVLLKEAVSAPQGMILVTGPTGSGKTTTLYAALQYTNDPTKNIMTAEDPVEYYLEGLGQVQINEKIGLGFQTTLRAFLRQDPEVILVGEIRDQETVDMAVKASLTGHLLLSSLHTNNAISTISRLSNMGVSDFMISAALSLVVSQRLARRNCTNCLIPDLSATKDITQHMGFAEEQINTISFQKGAGCDDCEHTGYKGRQGVYEVLSVTPDLEMAILNQANPQELLEVARLNGFYTMQDMGLDYIKSGVLCLEEYSRVLVVC